MHEETKKAVRGAINIGKVLFSLGPERYEKLVRATKKIASPTSKEIQELMEQGKTFNEAIETWFYKAYAMAAIDAGFEERHGVAMLKYAALLKDLQDGTSH